MPRFRVVIAQSHLYEYVIEAEDSDEARNVASDRYAQCDRGVPNWLGEWEVVDYDEIGTD